MIRLPAAFTPTHQTAGLPGYPAIDVFGDPGEIVEAGFVGTVRRISGHPCAQGGQPGGALGQSLYIVSPNGDDRYLTHLDRLFVGVGFKVDVGTKLATLCDSAKAHKPNTTHCHYGLKKSGRPMPPPEPLYDVVGPKGKVWLRKAPLVAALAEAGKQAKRLGSATVRRWRKK